MTASLLLPALSVLPAGLPRAVKQKASLEGAHRRRLREYWSKKGRYLHRVGRRPGSEWVGVAAGGLASGQVGKQVHGWQGQHSGWKAPNAHHLIFTHTKLHPSWIPFFPDARGDGERGVPLPWQTSPTPYAPTSAAPPHAGADLSKNSTVGLKGQHCVSMPSQLWLAPAGAAGGGGAGGTSYTIQR